MQTLTIEPTTHRGDTRLKLVFPYNETATHRIRTIAGCKWSRTMKCWHIPVIPDASARLKKLLVDWDIQIASQAVNNVSKQDGIQEESATISGSNQIVAETDAGKKLFYVSIPFNIKDEFKKLEGSWWHRGARKWSAVDTPENRQQLEQLLSSNGFGLQFTGSEKPQNTSRPQRKEYNGEKAAVLIDERFERMMHLEGLCESTIRQYKSYAGWYLSVYKDKDPALDPVEKVKSFVYDHVIKSQYGLQQQNGVISALKRYYATVHYTELDTSDIPRPKKRRNLPKVISEEEFKQMCIKTRNHKHRLIMKLLFGCGLRRNEVCELKVQDVNFDSGLIFVKGKGKKYRAVNPGNKLLNEIGKYLKSYLPKEYLFEGDNGSIYSGTSVYNIVSNAARIAGIKRNVYPHMLRHTFATLLMDRGVELRLIQEAMGHASSKTTEIYTYVSRASIKKMPALLDHIDF